MLFILLLCLNAHLSWVLFLQEVFSCSRELQAKNSDETLLSSDHEEIATTPFPSRRKEYTTKSSSKDEQFYVSYFPSDVHTEKGYAMAQGSNGTFLKKMQKSTIDFMEDDQDGLSSRVSSLKWDRKKKKYIKNGRSDDKYIRNEAGILIKSSYKTHK
jgi:hypothetical protein